MATPKIAIMKFAVVLAAILLIVVLGSLGSTARAAEMVPCSTAPEGGYCSECSCPGAEQSDLTPGVEMESTGEMALFTKALLGDPLLTLQESLGNECSETSCGCGDPFGTLGMRNPAAVYCAELGYEYRIEETAEGQRGVCMMPNGEALDEWQFYGGEVGQEFSYCAQKGWQTAKITADNFTTECTTCVLPDGTQKTVSELLKLPEKCEVGAMRRNETPKLTDAVIHDTTSGEDVLGLPSSFDWRNYNGQNWMTPVKNQGSCGSCWAFSAVGTVEAVYNIFTNNPNLDLDLSEQYLVSTCCSECGSCSGGWHGDALEFIRDEGITDEACYPYRAQNSYCSERCSDWSSRLYTIDSYGSVPENRAAIKQYLTEKGPLAVALKVQGTGDGFVNGIYRCTILDLPANHAVVIVGYNETGGYWIAKNSWGATWNGNGYFNVGYGECSIETEALYYAALADNTPPTVEIRAPANGTWFDSAPVNVTFYPWDNQDSSLNYKIFVDISEVANGTAARGANKTVNLGILPECSHMIRVNVTDDFGLQGSDAVTVNVDLTPPLVQILAPANDTWFAGESINLTFSAVDNKATVINYSIFDGEVKIANGTVANGTITNVTINTTALGDCNHVLRVNVSDTVGKTNWSSILIHIDLTPPVAEILAPANGTWFDSEPVNVSFRLSDNKAATLNYSLTVDGIEVKNGTVANGTTTEVSLGILGEGTRVIRVTARDSVGKTNFSEVTVYVDLTPPTVAILAPANGTWLDSAPFNLSFLPRDNQATSLNYSIFDGETAIANGTAANGTIKNVTLDPTALGNCDHILRVNVTDKAGKANSSSVTVHIDLIPPIVTILAPANDSWFDSEHFNLSFAVADNKAAMLTYAVLDNGVELANGTAANGSITNLSLDPLALGECDHVIRVNVTDTVGKTNSSSVTIHIDSTPPTVAILAPANDSWLDSAPVNVTFLPCDNKAATLTYSLYLNGTEQANGTAANCTTKEVNLGVLPECDHVVTVEVRDMVGKMNSSDVLVHIDLTPPTVEILAPANDTWLCSELLNLSFRASDNKAALLNYSIFDGGTEIRNGSATNGSITNITLNTSALGECDHVLRVTATDNSGKTGSDNITVHIDLTPPTIEVLEPANGTCFDSEQVNVSFRLWDTKADAINYSLVLDGSEVENGTLANGSEREVALGMLAECAHTIRINATDTIGLAAVKEISIHVDLTPPTVSLVSPEEGMIYRKACVNLNFIADDPGICPCGVAVQYYVLDGGAPVLIAGNTTIGNLEPCDHTVVLSIEDGGGKQASAIVNFTAHPGDISGDGRVNIFDLQRLAWSFMSHPGSANWDPDADLNGDNAVNIFDLQIMAWRFMSDYNVLC